MDATLSKAEQIARLNDQLRISPASDLGHWTFAGDLAHVIRDATPMDNTVRVLSILLALAEATFTEDNDPHGERDFGTFDLDGQRTMWKINYYNRDMSAGSEDPSDPAKTTRLLTIFYARDY